MGWMDKWWCDGGGSSPLYLPYLVQWQKECVGVAGRVCFGEVGEAEKENEATGGMGICEVIPQRKKKGEVGDLRLILKYLGILRGTGFFRGLFFVKVDNSRVYDLLVFGVLGWKGGDW